MIKDVKGLVSVVVPVYKVEKYLRPCLDSILAQSYNNWEAILVDDGSPDSCGNICDEYAEKDGRFRVIHQENGGLSHARNEGMKVAKGEYLYFLDSDDFLTPEALRMLVSLCLEHGAQISVHSFLTVNEDGEPIASNRTKYESWVMSGAEALENMLLERGFTVSAWSKLYRRDLFGGIEYPKGKLNEDLGTTWKVFLKAPLIAFEQGDTYCYRVRSNSITHTEFKVNMNDGLVFAREIIYYSQRETPRLLKSARYKLAVVLRSRLIGIGRSEMRSSQLRKDMQRELRDVWRKLKGEPLFSLRDKMSFFLAGWMFPLFTLALSARSALTSRIKIKVKE